MFDQRDTHKHPVIEELCGDRAVLRYCPVGYLCKGNSKIMSISIYDNILKRHTEVLHLLYIIEKKVLYIMFNNSLEKKVIFVAIITIQYVTEMCEQSDE